MLRTPIAAIIGAIVAVVAIGAVVLYGIGDNSVQQAIPSPPAVLDKLRLTHQQADRGDRRGDRGDRGERRRNRGDRGDRADRGNRFDGDRAERRERRRAARGDRGERRRDRYDDYGGGTETAPTTQTAPTSETGPSADGTQTAPTDADGSDRRAERRRNRGERGERGDRRGRQRASGTAVWQDASGKRVQLSDFRGRFVVLNLWATWCAPCISELPALARARAALAGHGVEVIAVDLEKQDAARIAEFLKTHSAEGLGVHIDQDLVLMRRFNAYALPLTILFDKNGREFGRASGPQKWDHPDAIDYLKDVADVDVAQRSDKSGRGDRRDRGDRNNWRWLTKLFRWAH
jgi:thiol-disulfide isomerase/thioredoxin